MLGQTNAHNQFSGDERAVHAENADPVIIDGFSVMLIQLKFARCLCIASAIRSWLDSVLSRKQLCRAYAFTDTDIVVLADVLHSQALNPYLIKVVPA